MPKNLNPIPNPKITFFNPKISTLNPRISIQNHKISTLYPKISTVNQVSRLVSLLQHQLQPKGLKPKPEF